MDDEGADQIDNLDFVQKNKGEKLNLSDLLKLCP